MGLAQAAILTAGYSPAIGFIHTGKALSFVYDIADLYKVELIVPLVFELIAWQRAQRGAAGPRGLPRAVSELPVVGADTSRHPGGVAWSC